MTFAIGHSGTHAGWKKPMGNATPWQCGCLVGRECKTARCDGLEVDGMCPFGYGATCAVQFRRNAAYLVRCNDCGVKRP